ncbi:MAG TPA: triose-phosphate isomerase [Clostridiales bacterium]|jgi:triosephosphate isomerase|nr:triose-phosphate isomerase [Clostridiales bacterium]
MRMPLIAGNWKMFKTRSAAAEFAAAFLQNYTASDVEVAILAPFTNLADLVQAFKSSGVKIGAQNMHFADEGAYTGEISPLMLKDLNIDYCIIGHSERRQHFAETDEVVNQKLKAAFRHGINPILCVGEVRSERETGQASAVVTSQLNKALTDIKAREAAGLTVAYEPVWAIGTGLTATPEQAGEMCAVIRQILIDLYGEETADQIRILYGGSVKPDNATELLNQYEIDGALVGGASLDPVNFLNIVQF